MNEITSYHAISRLIRRKTTVSDGKSSNRSSSSTDKTEMTIEHMKAVARSLANDSDPRSWALRTPARTAGLYVRQQSFNVGGPGRKAMPTIPVKYFMPSTQVTE